MKFTKHIGKHGDRKVAIMYRTVPGEEHMALVIYPELLQVMFHDTIMKVIESDIGQNAEQLSDALDKSLLPDGRQILQTLHKEGKIKKVRTNEIIVTPNATSHVRLDELNKIFDGIDAGAKAAENLEELNQVPVDPVEQQQNEVLLQDAGAGVVDNNSLASNLLEQSEKMLNESNALITESKRLRAEAISLDPKLKPKKPKKKAAKKKAAKKSA